MIDQAASGEWRLELKYHCIANRTYLDSVGLDLHNRIYKMWKDEWVKIYAAQGSTHQPTADDFVRHDLIVALTYRTDIVAYAVHSFLDLNDLTTYDRDYFTMFGTPFANALKDMEIFRVMTMESLVTNPKYKHNQWNVPVGRLLIRIAAYLFDFSNADGLMAVARKDNNLSQNSDELGWKTVITDQICRGFPCDLRVLPRGQHLALQPQKFEPLAGELWNSRQLHSGKPFTTLDQPTRKLKIAA